MNERELTDLLDRASADLDPDVSRLVVAGAARGRRSLRRRRAGAAVGATAVAGAIAAGATLLPGDGRPVTGTDPGIATSPSNTTDTGPDGERRFGVDPAKTAHALQLVLPAGVVSDHRSSHHKGVRAGRVLLDGARVTVVVERGVVATEECNELPSAVACTTHGDDGWTWSATEATGEYPGVVSNTAAFYTADGFSVTATAYNGPGEETAPDRVTPVLTREQLLDVVLDPIWIEEPQ